MTTPDTRFARYREAIGRLATAFPAVHAVLRPGEDVTTLDGWAAMAKRAAQQGDEPAMVATLYGPSGAGKSTLFRLLTGIDVPVSVRRPWTRASVVATPSRIAETARLDPYFREFRLEPLRAGDVDRLRHADARDTLYHLPSPRLDAADGPLLLLADVPDFNSVESENRTVCERMRDRAEVVVFVTHATGYADKAGLAALATCCGLAASLVFVVTQVSPRVGAAGEIWEDLTKEIIGRPATPEVDFEARRADERTRAEFLRGCPVYFSEYTAAPTLDGIRPLVGASSLPDTLRGLDGASAVVRGLAEASAVAVRTCRGILNEARARRQRVEENLARAAALIRERAARVAGSEFPSGRWMEIVLEETRAGQAGWKRVVTKPLRWLAAPRRWIGDVRTSITNLFRPDGRVRDREELETERLGEAAEDLTDAWRKVFVEEATTNGVLATERCGRTRAEFTRQSPPPPKQDWEEAVRVAVRGWAERNPTLSRSLPVVTDLMTVGGFGLLVVDLVTTGGLFGSAVVLGSVGVVGAAAAGGGILGELLKWVERWNLDSVARAADRAWKDQRSAELSDHLRAHLANPLFRPWQEDLDRLRPDRIAACEAACAEVETLVARPPNGFRLIGRGDGNPPAGH